MQRLRSELHAIAADDAAWPAFLVDFARFLGASEVVLGGSYAGRGHMMVAPHTDAGLVGIYNDTYHQQNALMLKVLSRAAGSVTMTEALPEFEHFQHSDLYNLWCVPQDFNHAVALSVRSSTGWGGAIVVNTRRPVTADQEQFLMELSPDLQQAVERWAFASQMRSANRLTLDTLDITGMGALFLDRAGRVLDCNQTAQAMLDSGRISVVGGHLTGATAADDGALGKLISKCLNAPDKSGGRLQLESQFGPLQAHCVPFPGSMSYPYPHRPHVIVLLSDPTEKLRQRLNTLAHLHGLTHAEIELALAVVHTGNRKAAAALRGVSDATARSQLTSIFDKTGVRGQTALVRWLLGDG